MNVHVLTDKFRVSKTQIIDTIANKDVLYKAWVGNGKEKQI